MKLGDKVIVVVMVMYVDGSEVNVFKLVFWKFFCIVIVLVKDGIIQVNGKGKVIIMVSYVGVKIKVIIVVEVK